MRKTSAILGSALFFVVAPCLAVAAIPWWISRWEFRSPFLEALLFGDRRLAIYAVLFWLVCHAFVLVYEEPTLRRTFGAEFEDFCAKVPRWIPLPRPWQAP